MERKLLHEIHLSPNGRVDGREPPKGIHRKGYSRFKRMRRRLWNLLCDRPFLPLAESLILREWNRLEDP